MTLATRFWAKVERQGPGDCWPWTGSRSGGYGQIKGYEGEVLGAHRVVLRLTGVALPEGSQVHHLCGNRHCVNPGHLEVVASQAEHSARHTHGCRTHGMEDLRRVKSGRNVGMLYCAVCSRIKAQKHRARARRDVLLEGEVDGDR